MSYIFYTDLAMTMSLTEEVQHSLTQQVAMEEVIYTMNQMHPFKAPDVDGLHGIFLK